MKRLGLGSFACAWQIEAGWLDAVGLIERAYELGLQVVQIGDNLPLRIDDLARLNTIRQAAEGAGIELELGVRGLVLPLIHEYLELCQTLHVQLLRIVIDTPSYEPSAGEIVFLARKLLPMLRDAGVTLAIENHDRLRARVLSEIVSEIANGAVRVCLDTANSFGATEGPEQAAETLGAQAANLHLKDFVIRREAHQMGFRISGVPAGQGMLDIPWLLARLDAFGSRGNVILELWPDREASIEETAAKERRWCEESVAYMRTLIAN